MLRPCPTALRLHVPEGPRSDARGPGKRDLRMRAGSPLPWTRRGDSPCRRARGAGARPGRFGAGRRGEAGGGLHAAATGAALLLLAGAARGGTFPHGQPRRARACQRGARAHIAAVRSEENTALVFVKPHAGTTQVLELVQRLLQDRKVEVLRKGSIDAAEIDARGIIDSHYAAIAKVGMTRDIASLGLGAAEAERFAAGYGRQLEEVLAAGQVYSAVTALEVLRISPSELLSRCLEAGYVKLRSGLYCARLEGGGEEPQELYVLNGFYARMREKFVAPGVVVNWFLVRFKASELSWSAFRSEVIGATQPIDAADGSLRAAIRDRWRELGLREETNYQDNGVHASAGPLEALRERAIWLGDDPRADAFGAALALQGEGGAALEALLENPVVAMGGKEGSAFDLLEDMDSAEALDVLADCTILGND
mmetsp:Transcript_57325/g.177946  ORF Transcript_57325/g.177946 Transcript_57325/m.177946 type:complete len:425 (+) Transcript_57325:77-1351(+)